MVWFLDIGRVNNSAVLPADTQCMVIDPQVRPPLTESHATFQALAPTKLRSSAHTVFSCIRFAFIPPSSSFLHPPPFRFPSRPFRDKCCPLIFLISTPAQSRIWRQWDLLIIWLLIYTAIVTPVEVAFIESTFGVQFVINRLIDLAFMVVSAFPRRRHDSCFQKKRSCWTAAHSFQAICSPVSIRSWLLRGPVLNLPIRRTSS